MKKQTTLFFCLLLILSACMQESPLERVLKMAGENRAELQQVLDHYSKDQADSLKRKAAVFLIENMPYYSYYESENLDILKNSIYRTAKEQNVYIPEAISIIKEQLGGVSVTEYQKKRDVQNISAEYLIRNIEYAFMAWEKAPWRPHVSFSQFCREILPYRIADEFPENWREVYYNRFSPVLDSLLTDSDPVTASQVLYDYLVQDEWLFTTELNLPHLGPLTLLNNRIGGCLEYCDFVLYVMRSVGIPCGIDLILQNPDRMYAAHYWNYVTDTLGNHIDFTLYEHRPDPGVRDRNRKKGKVYRNHFDLQAGSLPILYPEKVIPATFQQLFITDVSHEYNEENQLVFDVPKTETKEELFYLSVFNNRRFIPIAWTTIHKGQATFTHLEGEVAYFPTYYYNGETQAAGYPVIIRDGQTITLQPDTFNRQTVCLHRKHPIPNWWPVYSYRSLNGRFQGSNDEYFRNATDLHVIDEEAEMRYYLVETNNQNRYRYVRYLSADDGYCNMAEVKFLSEGEELRGEVIGTEGAYKNNASRTKRALFDDDPLTFYDAMEASGAWAGLDLVEPRRIDQIRYLFRNDDNNIRKGDLYELFFFDQQGMVSLGKKTGTDEGVLIYENIPSNVMLLLHNHTRGQEERIFTYEEGTQKWW